MFFCILRTVQAVCTSSFPSPTIPGPPLPAHTECHPSHLTGKPSRCALSSKDGRWLYHSIPDPWHLLAIRIGAIGRAGGHALWRFVMGLWCSSVAALLLFTVTFRSYLENLSKILFSAARERMMRTKVTNRTNSEESERNSNTIVLPFPQRKLYR